MTLFEINKAISDFEFDIDEETGEILNADALDELEMAREDKIEGVALWVKNLEAEKEAVANQEKIFADRKSRLGKKIESLKKWLAYALDGQKFSTDRVQMSFRKSKSVHITDEYLVPNNLCDYTMVRKVNKTAVKQAIEAGEEVMGAELVEKQNLQLK